MLARARHDSARPKISVSALKLAINLLLITYFYQELNPMWMLNFFPLRSPPLRLSARPAEKISVQCMSAQIAAAGTPSQIAQILSSQQCEAIALNGARQRSLDRKAAPLIEQEA